MKGCGKARQTAGKKFLLTRYVEQYLDLFGVFGTCFRFRQSFAPRPFRLPRAKDYYHG
jgi:hypothetical protein